jgi:hypothetical protein
MKKLLLVALPAGLAILAAVLALGAFRDRREAYDALNERARLKRDFAERAGFARAMTPQQAQAWRDEVLALSRWYFDELGAIRNRHPREPARAAADPGGDRKGKAASEQERATAKEFRAYADARLATLREGKYAPVASAVDQGLRLDLAEIATGPSPEGGAPGLRIDFALWGAPRYLERERERERTTTRSVVPLSFRRIAFRFLDAKGKPYGEMNGPGEPYLKLADPERWSDDFPPGVLFGTWWVDLFPREAVTVEIEVETAARGASGAERPVAMKLALPVAEGWKLPPGATFQAEVREVAPAPAVAK